MKIKLEYVWLDGYKPEPNLRSKVKIVEYESIKNAFLIDSYSTILTLLLRFGSGLYPSSQTYSNFIFISFDLLYLLFLLL